jgi:RNA polymerase sigma-70 factor (ECF subfamily)
MLAPRPRSTEPDDPIDALIARGEHREAIAECARRHGRALGRLCMALCGTQADADEAAQETLLAAHAQLGAWRGDGSVRAWLFGIARRICARRWERGQREARHLASVPEPRTPGAPEPELVRARRAHAVRAALATLRPTEREVLVLHYQGELSFREIAAICGVDEVAARKRASRGLARLRGLLGSEEIG